MNPTQKPGRPWGTSSFFRRADQQRLCARLALLVHDGMPELQAARELAKAIPGRGSRRARAQQLLRQYERYYLPLRAAARLLDEDGWSITARQIDEGNVLTPEELAGEGN